MSGIHPDFSRAIVALVNFRPKFTKRAQAALLLIGLRQDTFTAADLPGEITQGDIHIAGAACKSLSMLGLIVSCGRVPSPIKEAHGRPLNVWKIPSAKHSTVMTWFQRNGFTEEELSRLLIGGAGRDARSQEGTPGTPKKGSNPSPTTDFFPNAGKSVPGMGPM